MGEIKRESRELAYEGTIVKVYKDHVVIDGKRAVWDYIQHNGAAAVVPILENGKILLVRQYRNALDRYTLELPAGKVDAGDEPRRICAFRELREEEIDIFVAKNLKKGEQDLDEDESIDIEEWELDDLLELIYKGELKDSKTVAAILAYKNKYAV